MRSDAICVLNVGGYVGDSTRREIALARVLNKQVYSITPMVGALDATVLLRKGENL